MVTLICWPMSELGLWNWTFSFLRRHSVPFGLLNTIKMSSGSIILEKRQTSSKLSSSNQKLMIGTTGKRNRWFLNSNCPFFIKCWIYIVCFHVGADEKLQKCSQWLNLSSFIRHFIRFRKRFFSTLSHHNVWNNSVHENALILSRLAFFQIRINTIKCC